MIWHTFFQPFIEFGFMRRALVVCLALSLSTTMLGVFPAAAAHEPDGRCAVARHSPRRGGGVSAERHVAAGHDPRRLHRRHRGCPGGRVGEPADTVKRGRQFCRILSGLAGPGVTTVSLRGSSVDLLHLLFGSILAVDRDAALFVSGVASLTLLCIALCYRGLVSEAFDSAWLQVNHRRLPALLHGLFLALLVLNLVAGFQVLGTLMAVGVMMLPAVAARCWARTLPGILLLAAGMGALCAWLGLSLSGRLVFPPGPLLC